MIGKVNSAGGPKKLVVAQGSNSAGLGKEFYTTLTCDFDPLVVVAVGPDVFGPYGRYQTNYRLSKSDNWQSDKSSHSAGILSISGRTITAGPFEEDDTGPTYSGKILAFGFVD